MASARNIPLKGKKMAIYKGSKDNDGTRVHAYRVPCPVCSNSDNTAYSYDQQVFITYQIVCKNCGVYFRPVPDPQHIEIEKIMQIEVDNKGNYRPIPNNRQN